MFFITDLTLQVSSFRLSLDLILFILYDCLDFLMYLLFHYFKFFCCFIQGSLYSIELLFETKILRDNTINILVKFFQVKGGNGPRSSGFVFFLAFVPGNPLVMTFSWQRRFDLKNLRPLCCVCQQRQWEAPYNFQICQQRTISVEEEEEEL